MDGEESRDTVDFLGVETIWFGVVGVRERVLVWRGGVIHKKALEGVGRGSRVSWRDSWGSDNSWIRVNEFWHRCVVWSLDWALRSRQNCWQICHSREVVPAIRSSQYVEFHPLNPQNYQPSSLIVTRHSRKCLMASKDSENRLKRKQQEKKKKNPS